MHPMITISASPSVSQSKYIPAARPVAGFARSPWGDRFLNYTPPDTKVIEAQKEVAKQLKEEISRDLMSMDTKPLMEQLRLIDSIEQLGVAYHFDKEIDNALLHIYETEIELSEDDLVLTSLRFRLLRQHGFKVSSDLFKEYIDSNGSLKKEVANDVHGILNLYEACYLRVHGEEILEKALPQIIIILNKMVTDQHNDDTLLEERIRHSLQLPLHKRIIRFNCVRYIRVYEEDDPLHNKPLLQFAKLDFNLLQELYKEEISELCRYWHEIDFPGNLPLRDRMVEGHAWTTGGYYEPQYSIGRKITSIGGHLIVSIDDFYDAYATFEEAQIFTQAVQSIGDHLIVSIDDFYDAYATFEEAQIFTQAVHRWDWSCLEELPEGLKWIYKTMILEAHEEFERLLAPSGRSHYVEYAKEEVKAVCRSYLTEAKWRKEKYVPTLEEYIQLDLYRNTGYVGTMIYFFLGISTTSDHDFQWICNLANPVKAVSYHLRIVDDVGGNKFDKNRGLSSMCIECYMKEYGLSYEEACKELYNKGEELWKDINEGMVRPTEVTVEAYNTVINMARVAEAFYSGGEDGYTLVNHNLKKIVKDMYIHSFSM